jgi:nucleotide-binding universal stress UspA family protein
MMRILITADGSDFSKAAVEKCCEMLVKPENTAIKIVSVYEIPVPMDAFPTPTEFSEKLEQSAQKQAEEFAEQSAVIIREKFPDLKIDLTTQVSMGTPEQILLETAKDWKADLIVVADFGDECCSVR